VIHPDICLGVTPPDEDSDGHDTTFATGDDITGIDDEESFNAYAVHPVPGRTFDFPITVTNETSTLGEVSCFVDWNDDGDFADADEQAVRKCGKPSFRGRGHNLHGPV